MLSEEGQENQSRKKLGGMARLLITGVAAGGSGDVGLSFGASLIVCSFIVMACGSHVWWRRRRCSKSVMSIHQVQPGEDGDVCVWQKSILMGEKCQLPDFSGIITYDSAGNLVTPGRPRMALL